MLGKRKIRYSAVTNQLEGVGDHDDFTPDDAIEFVNPESVQPRRIFNQACCWKTTLTCALILTYFAPSIALTFYQRWLLQRIPFPLSIVLVHMTVKYLLAMGIRMALMFKQGRPRMNVTWREYIVNVAPIGAFSGIDIGFSNWGLQLITVSLYTMTKSTTIIFILGFAILLKLEKRSWSLSFIVATISVGLILFTYKATQFNTLGFVLLLLASMASGVRWSCVQLLLQRSSMGMRNPIDMIYFMQPWMLVSLMPFALWIEGPALLTHCQLLRARDLDEVGGLFALILIGAAIAFFMEATEVMVVTYTSSLTLSVAGIFKELLILVMAVLINGDQMSGINLVGLAVCLVGIMCHVVHKLRTQQPNASARRLSASRNEYSPEEQLQRVGLMDSDVEEEPIALGATKHSRYNGHLYASSGRTGSYVHDDSDDDTEVLFNILNSRDR